MVEKYIGLSAMDGRAFVSGVDERGSTRPSLVDDQISKSSRSFAGTQARANTGTHGSRAAFSSEAE